MKYNYKCENCKTETTVTKSMYASDRVEYCEECGTILKRVWSSATIKTSDGVKS